jgi:hypothetical protein
MVKENLWKKEKMTKRVSKYVDVAMGWLLRPPQNSLGIIYQKPIIF